jgi:aspartate carbamoyltransferase regulatory subunit
MSEDRELILSMINNFLIIDGIDDLRTSHILNLMKMRLEESDEFNSFLAHAREVLADTKG